MKHNEITTARIDYNGGQEWYAYLMNGSVQAGGLSAHELSTLLKGLKTHYPNATVEYTHRAWNQNVNEFERDRHWRR